jgi:hypothetical protein
MPAPPGRRGGCCGTCVGSVRSESVDREQRHGRNRQGRYRTGQKYCAGRIFFLHGVVDLVFFERELAWT